MGRDEDRQHVCGGVCEKKENKGKKYGLFLDIFEK